MHGHQQVDLILLNFAKDIDRVPHRRLLSAKIIMQLMVKYTSGLIKMWLMQRFERVMLDGDFFTFCAFLKTVVTLAICTNQSAGSPPVFND